MEHLIGLVQGIYFLVFGIWPIIHMNSFLRITGPKIDLWLVKTVGMLLVVIGAVLVFAYYQAEINSAIVFLAIGSALSLAVVELIYVAKRVIFPIYLADAVVELALITWWLLDLLVFRFPLA